MATQKALITTKADFIGSSSLAGVPTAQINPLLFSDAENLPAEVDVVGTSPLFVDGVRGKAIHHGGVTAYKWNNVNFADVDKRMLSFWYKPATEDVQDTGSNWKVLATHRGLGTTNYGFQVALYNGKLNVRVYGSNGSLNLYTDGGSFPLWTFTADTLYHVCVLYDEGGTFPLEVYVNKSRMLYSGVVITLGAFTRSFTVGDLLSSGGGLQYTLYGDVDEVIYTEGNEVWDVATMKAYYDAVLAGNYIDYLDAGSIVLGKDTVGQYTDQVIPWESEPLDLGVTGFEAFGRVQMNYDVPDTTTITLYTRSSSDGVAWSAYTQIREDGLILSPDNQYLQIKVELSTSYLETTPQINELQVLDYSYIQPDRFPLYDEPLKIYKDLGSGLEYLGVFANAYDIVIEEEINAADEITFKVPINDPKRKELGEEPVELIVEISGRQYIVREVKDERTTGGTLRTVFKGERFFYELRDFKVKELDLKETTAYKALNTILSNAEPSCNWTVKTVEIPSTKTRDLKIDWTSVLQASRNVTDLWGGEIIFDESVKEISLLNKIGKDNGIRFYYNKNLKSVERVIDTFELITRLYPYGNDGLTISSVNGGVEYVENFTWVDALGLRNRVRVDKWKNTSYIYPQNLKDDAEIILADISKPKVSYGLSVQDLSSLSGHEHETFDLGDTVYTIDKDLFSIEFKSRIVRRKYVVREPWKTTVELSQPKKLLSDAMRKEIDDKITALETANLMDTNDVKQMTVFNSLLNSRADEGFIDWLKVGTGFELANVGFSGDWSFRCVGNFGQENKITQRVYGISHRTAYTVSGAIATDGEIVRGGTIVEPFVGIKAKIYYKDGSAETKYLGINS